MSPFDLLLSIFLLASVTMNYYLLVNHASARELNYAYEKGLLDAATDIKDARLAADRGIDKKL